MSYKKDLEKARDTLEEIFENIKSDVDALSDLVSELEDIAEGRGNHKHSLESSRIAHKRSKSGLGIKLCGVILRGSKEAKRREEQA